MPPTILDSHIHLWPSTATSSQDHAWMTPGLFLARRHGVHDYAAATAAAPVQPAGFVYVETDRYLPSASLSLDAGAGDEEVEEKLSAWARAPLEELAFLRRVVEGDVQEGDGASEGDGEQMKGLVIWAPFHVQERVFGTYLRVARERLGEKAWARVVGFRYLLQGRTADEVKSIIGNEWFVSNVKLACEKGERRLAFDVGVDAHRDGIEALEAVAALIEGVEEGVNFVLNHLCKPDLSTPTWPFFPRWQACIGRLSSHPNVYMKLSGALNEFAPSATPSSVETVLDTLRPYLDYVLQSFGAHRVLFGSDWPVCNVGGPKGEVGNWGFWVEVVERYWEEKELSEKDIEWVWAKSAAAAYGIKELR
ncbi:hypothetical protein DPSP01_009282 [Paraphaeosphaeria sporulosa]|uniref:Amidohydrolase-related domain-containing protein n=1 Tax=Paraphaeosphaeria sporulosa TaxID=1460663 RepID=A0A177C1M7_9PLEO|nr:uncharacterized protein CC84DRAFT_1154047 [Paraphaeosphaeria sporulosa]OAG00779.1 hypothetical protein CC84DRAFT_1154047 [Paraphaeosphaeria sporulosa]